LDDCKAAQKSLPFLQKAITLSIENTGNTSIHTGTIHYHLSSALLLCGRYKETIEHANKVINCISANGLDSGIFKAQSILDCANTHILNSEDKDALRMIILQLEIGSSQGIESFYKATKTASLLMEKDRENIKVSTWKHVASLIKNRFWEFDAEFNERSISSPASYGTKELDNFFKMRNMFHANHIVLLGYYSALFETSQEDVCRQSLNILKAHAWKGADIDVQFEMIRNIECAVLILKYLGEEPYLEDLIDEKKRIKIRRG
jgi:hypothetical protein